METDNKILMEYQAVIGRLSEGKGNLRFGRRAVKISDVAQQYYCEKALELRYEHPLPPTERMQKGEAGHENITALAEPISREESIKEALEKREKPLCMYEFGVAWKHSGIPIIGYVDEAWFRGGNVDLVVERKFSNSLNVYSPYHVQAQLYCLGLGEMGFNNSETQYKITVLKRQCYDCSELTSGSCNGLSQSVYKCDKGECISFTYPFDRVKVIKDLDWAIDFWLDKREAVPTRVQAKCRACAYKNLCGSSLIQ